MRKAKAYLCMCYRGENADGASDEDIQVNIDKAVLQARAIHRAFPESLELYVPHLNEAMVHRLWKKGYVTSTEILDVCCDIVAEQDFVIAFRPLSKGMEREMHYAIRLGMPVLYFDVFDDEAKEVIAMAILKYGENNGKESQVT